MWLWIKLWIKLRNLSSLFISNFLSRSSIIYKPSIASLSIIMDDERKATNEPLVFYHHVGKLRKLAEMSLLAELMQHSITRLIRRKCQNKEGRANPYAYRCEHDLIEAELPPSLCTTCDLEFLNYDMHRSRVNWWTYHYKCVFSHRESPDSIINLFPLLVWLPDASISYEQTARKMLNCDELTNVEKFMVACTYCFMDDVVRLQQTLTKNELKDATSGHRRYGVPFLDYWHSKLYNSIDNLYIATWHINLLNRLLSSLKYYDNWPAVEYFWNQVDYDKRLHEAVVIIDLDKPALTWHLLVKLSGSELDVVIEKRSLQIIRTLVKELKYFEYIILTWKRMVNLIDDQALADIMRFVHKFQDCSKNFMNDLLWEMWLCISERQKMVIVDKHICDFVQKSLNTECDFYYHQNLPLIIDVLSRFTAERRLQYWSLHWRYLVLGQLHEKTSIDRIMELCLGNDKTIAVFKSTEMLDYDSISSYCQYHAEYGYFDELQEYLEFCTSDLEIIRNLKRQIITKMSKVELFNLLFRNHQSDIDQFNQFMEGLFTPTEYAEFMYKMILHPKTLKEMCSLCTCGSVDGVISVVEKFLTCEEHRVKVKLELFENCRVSDQIERSMLVDLTAWCFNGDKILVEQFKKLLPPVRDAYVADDVVMKEVPTSIYDTFHDEWLK